MSPSQILSVQLRCPSSPELPASAGEDAGKLVVPSGGAVRKVLIRAFGAHSELLPTVLKAWRQHTAKHRALQEDIGLILQLRAAALSAPALLASAWQVWKARRMLAQNMQPRAVQSNEAIGISSGSSAPSTSCKRERSTSRSSKVDLQRHMTQRAAVRLSAAGFLDLDGRKDDSSSMLSASSSMVSAKESHTSPLHEDCRATLSERHGLSRHGSAGIGAESLRCRIQIALEQAYASEELAGVLLTAGAPASCESAKRMEPEPQDCETPSRAARLLMEGLCSLVSTAATTPEVSPMPADHQKWAGCSETLRAAEAPEAVSLLRAAEAPETAPINVASDVFLEFQDSSFEAVTTVPALDKSSAVSDSMTPSGAISNELLEARVRQSSPNSAEDRQSSCFQTPRSPRSEADMLQESQVDMHDATAEKDPREASPEKHPEQSSLLSQDDSAGHGPEHVPQSSVAVQDAIEGSPPVDRMYTGGAHEEERCESDPERHRGGSAGGVDDPVTLCDHGQTERSDTQRHHGGASASSRDVLHAHDAAETSQCECSPPCLRIEQLSNVVDRMPSPSEKQKLEEERLEQEDVPLQKAHHRAGCCPCRRHRAARDSQSSEAQRQQQKHASWSNLSQTDVVVAGLIYEADVAERPSREDASDFV